jgi:hypothetical protein
VTVAAERGSPFLVRDASDEELLAATGHNHCDQLHRMARAGGGIVGEAPGGSWAYLAGGSPEVIVALLEPPGPRVPEHLDEVLEFCRQRRVARVGYWSLRHDSGPLGAWLAARGFRWGGAARWMVADLDALDGFDALATGGGVPPGQDLAPWSRLAGWDVGDLPCLDPAVAPLREAMCEERPQRFWQFVFSEDGRPVGQVSLNLTCGPLGVAGLFDAVILPSARSRGLGLGRFLRLYRFVADLGARYVVMNAFDHATSLYRLAGFRSLGTGQTWWLPGQELGAGVAPDRVAFAEAVGLGDVAALDALWSRGSPPDLADPLPNRMSALELAAATDRPESARWLLGRGAEPEVLAFWDLGWREEAERLLTRDETVALRRRPRSGKTPLHVAVERGDAALADVLLAHGADPEARDDRFGGTPLDWARHLRRPRVAAVIRRHRDVSAP